MLSDKELNKQIGAALRDERKRRRYTLEYVGERIGVSKSTVYLWESGRNGISAAVKPFCKKSLENKKSRVSPARF